MINIVIAKNNFERIGIMTDSLNRKISELFGKVDGKILEARLNAAIDMLKKGNTEELADKINKMDKNELLQKINDLDDSKLKQLNIDKNEISQRLGPVDFKNLANHIGENGDEIVKKLKLLLEKGSNT
jgi:hypothetical protein